MSIQSSQTHVVKALRAIYKSSPSAIKFDDVPEELLNGSDLDLSRWTMIVQDSTMKKLGPQMNSSFYLVDPRASTVGGMFEKFWFQSSSSGGLMCLNISNAKEVTDVGLAHVVRSNPNITDLDISGCLKLTDSGLREVGIGCSKLRKLVMIGCYSFEGTGLISIADCCRQLHHLDVSNCRSLQRWSLSKIFSSCVQLEEVHLNHLRDVSDDEVRVLALNCRHLLVIQAKESPCLSDHSIQILAQYCHDLDFIDFSRTSMAFRISDVSLLALGESSKSLRTLKLSGCENLTDVGLSWLTQNIAATLEVLDLTGCHKITDAGLRHVGQGCPSLRVFSISQAKLVSDIGIHSLSKGCPQLQEVNFHGLFLLSDPRVSPTPPNFAQASSATSLKMLGGTSSSSTKNKDTDFLPLPSKGSIESEDEDLPSLGNTNSFRSRNASFDSIASNFSKTSSIIEKNSSTMASSYGVSTIGLASLVQSCAQLTALDVSSCFRLNQIFQKQFVGWKQLRRLNLAGCNQITQQNMINIPKFCPQLEELNVNHCNVGISLGFLQQVALHCSQLRVLSLVHCPQAFATTSSQPFQAIAQLSKLEKLDCSHCSTLTDLLLLPLTEESACPHLHTLLLSQNVHLTDSCLAWMASKSHPPSLLSLLGTSISRKSCLAVQDRFPLSDLQFSDTFHGFVPKSRLKDRQLMNEYYKMDHGITKLQARQRRRTALKRVHRIQQERQQQHGLVKIQSWFRYLMALRLKRQLLAIKQRKYKAAVKITSLFHRVIALRRVAQRKRELRWLFSNRMATKIQVRWRIFLDQCWLESLREEERLFHQLQISSAIKIQSIARVYFVKQRILRMKALRIMQMKIRQRAAMHIQRVFRGHRGRMISRRAREIYEKHTLLREISGWKIQGAFRRHRTRVILKQRITLRWRRLMAVLLIQRIIRGRLARLHVMELRLDVREKREYEAALRIQSCVRVRQARQEFQRLIRQRLAERLKREAGALILQTYVRRNQAIKKRKVLQLEHEAMLRRQVELEMESIIRIQAFFRGCKGRERFDNLVRERKGRWKEVWDEKQQRRYFYNQITGEIRWRMPQDLLDLIPRPICDNCSAIEASLECKICNEVYCTACFQAVHHGGRRKEHEFRCLYDYYGKRLDYGDGSFPCHWPSEVQQDEVQGWMLRVAPIRDPVAVHDNGWEEYRDYVSGETEKKTFFFNRKTFEASYDKPGELVQQEWDAYHASLNNTGASTNYSYSHNYDGTSSGYELTYGYDHGYVDHSYSNGDYGYNHENEGYNETYGDSYDASSNSKIYQIDNGYGGGYHDGGMSYDASKYPQSDESILLSTNKSRQVTARSKNSNGAAAVAGVSGSHSSRKSQGNNSNDHTHNGSLNSSRDKTDSLLPPPAKKKASNGSRNHGNPNVSTSQSTTSLPSLSARSNGPNSSRLPPFPVPDTSAADVAMSSASELWPRSNKASNNKFDKSRATANSSDVLLSTAPSSSSTLPPLNSNRSGKPQLARRGLPTPRGE